MSKKQIQSYRYQPGERAAERELDAYLKTINAPSAVLDELRALVG